MLSAKRKLRFFAISTKKALFVLIPKVRFFLSNFWGAVHFQLSYLFFNIFDYFQCSSNSFFSITYATFASLLIKEHISIKLQKLSDRKIPLIYNLIPTVYFTFLTDKIIIRSIYFRRFLCHFYQKIGQDC